MTFAVKKYLTLTLGFCEFLFYSGIIYGWASLVYILKEEGYYSHLCQNQTVELKDDGMLPTTSCARQDAILNLVFTIASFVLQGSLFFFGLMFDHFGTRFTRLLLHILIAAGLLMMLLSSASQPELIFPGMIFLAMGGGQFIPANMQIANLFKNQKATVMSALGGAFDSAAAVFLFLKLAYDGGISLQTSFAIMIGITFIFFINTFVLLPTNHIPHNDAIVKDDTSPIPNSDHKTSDTAQACLVLPTTAETLKNENYPTFKACVLSPSFFLLMIWFSTLQLRSVYYVGTLNPYLVRLSDEDDSKVSHYTEVFSYLQLCAVFFAPFSGLILDRNKCRKVISNTSRGPYDDILDTAFGFVVATCFVVLFSVANLIPILQVQYFTFVLQVITRAFLYGLAVSVLPIMFPGKYFASLYGLLSGIGSFLLLLQFPLLIVTQQVFGDDPLVINAILLAACLLTFILPIYIYRFSRRKNKEIMLQQQSKGRENTNNHIWVISS